MQKIIFLLKVTVIVLCTASCSKSITGVLSDCNGREVSCKGYRFKVSGIAPKCGTIHSFTPVRKRNDKRINAKRIK